MKLAFFILAAISCLAMSSKKPKTESVTIVKKISNSQLDVIAYKQFDFPKMNTNPKDPENEHFNLSDFTESQGRVYATSDQTSAKDIYSVDWGKEKEASKIQPAFPHTITDKTELEAINSCGDTFYFCNLKKDTIYVMKKNEPVRKIKIDLRKLGVRRNFLSGGDGFMGMAVDCEHNIAYIINDHDPRFILNFDLEKSKILDKWDIGEPASTIFVDAKYEKGFLYLLEREEMTIAKVKIADGRVVKRYSYQNFEKSAGYLFAPSVHPMAKAMLLKDNEIWIGFNNNGLLIGKDAEKDLGIKGKRPLIVRLQRPSGF